MNPIQYTKFLALGAMLSFASTAHAQFLDAGMLWGNTMTMQGVSDIQTTAVIDGETVATSYVDAAQMSPDQNSSVQVGDTIFNPLFSAANTDISITVPGGWLPHDSNNGTFPTASPSSVDYSNVVSHFGYNNGGEGLRINFSNLTMGQTYEVELWSTSGFKSEFSGANAGDLGTGNTYVVGTFTAADTTASITAIDVAAYTTISDVALRQVSVPEPSTYALMLGGLTLLFVGLRHKRAALLS